jgi:hypothetical protein
MSNSLSVCPQCSDIFQDEYSTWDRECANCGVQLCCTICGLDYGLASDIRFSKSKRKLYCPFCRGEKATRIQLLEYALKKLELTEKELEELWIKERSSASRDATE